MMNPLNSPGSEDYRHSTRLAAWQTVQRTELLSCSPWLAVYQEQVRLPSGRTIDDFYRIVLPEFALVVPITHDGRFVMVRGYKHGAERVVLSPPAGLIAAGEAPQAAAERELREETGYQAAHWRQLASLVADGNRQCGRMHLFMATGAEQVVQPEADETEALEVVLLSREELLAAVGHGEVATMAAASGIGLALAIGSGNRGS